MIELCHPVKAKELVSCELKAHVVHCFSLAYTNDSQVINALRALKNESHESIDLACEAILRPTFEAAIEQNTYFPYKWFSEFARNTRLSLGLSS